MERKVSKTFISANLLGVEIHHNGSQGGDAGHGGFVKLKFIDKGSTAMDVEIIAEYDNIEAEILEEKFYGATAGLKIDSPHEITLKFMGDCERDTLIDALKFAIKELEENEYVKEAYEHHDDGTADFK